MNRLEFLKRLGLGAAAVVVAPKLLIGESEPKKITDPKAHLWAKGAITSDPKTELNSFKIRVQNISSIDVHDVVFLDSWSGKRLKIKDSYIDIATVNCDMDYETLLQYISKHPFKFDELNIRTNNSEQIQHSIHVITNYSRPDDFYKITRYFHLNYYLSCYQEDNKIIAIKNINSIYNEFSAFKISTLKANTYMDIEVILTEKSPCGMLTGHRVDGNSSKFTKNESNYFNS
jgi:hypothetical protein